MVKTRLSRNNSPGSVEQSEKVKDNKPHPKKRVRFSPETFQPLTAKLKSRSKKNSKSLDSTSPTENDAEVGVGVKLSVQRSSTEEANKAGFQHKETPTTLKLGPSCIKYSNIIDSKVAALLNEKSEIWVRLISQSSQYPTQQFGKGLWQVWADVDGNIVLSPCEGQPICQIKVESTFQSRIAVHLIALQGSRIAVNGGPLLRSNDQVALNGGDEVVIRVLSPSFRQLSYIAHILDMPIRTRHPTSFTSGPPSLSLRVPISDPNAENIRSASPVITTVTNACPDVNTADELADQGGSEPKVQETSTLFRVISPHDSRTATTSDHMSLQTFKKLVLNIVDGTFVTVSAPEDPEDAAAASVRPAATKFPGIQGAPADKEEIDLQQGNGREEAGQDVPAMSVRDACTNTFSPASTSGAVPEVSSAHRRISLFRDALRAAIIPSSALGPDLDGLPYVLGPATKQRLTATAHLHMKHSKFSAYATELPSMSPRILLTGPHGTELYQEALVASLARTMDAALLVFDRLALPGLEAHVSGTADLAEGAPSTSDKADGTCTSEPEDDGGFSDHFGTSADNARNVTSMCTLSLQPPDPCMPRAAKRRRLTETGGPSGPLWLAPGQNTPGEPGRGARGSLTRPLKLGDRVRYVGSGLQAGLSATRTMASRMPPVYSYLSMHSALAERGRAAKGAGNGGHPSSGPVSGSLGRVVLTFQSNPRRVGVRFDAPLPGAISLGDMCEEDRGFFCSTSDLRLEGGGKDEEIEAAALNALMEVAEEAAEKGPLVLLIKDVETALAHSERAQEFVRWVERLTTWQRVLVVGSVTSEARKSSSFGGAITLGSSSSWLSRLGPSYLDLESLSKTLEEGVPGSMFDAKRWWQNGSGDLPAVGRRVARAFPNRINLVPPTAEPDASAWRAAIEHDIGTLRDRSNRRIISQVLARCTLDCPDLAAVTCRDESLTVKAAEEVVGWAITACLERVQDPKIANGKLVLSAADVNSGIELLKKLAAEAVPPLKNTLRDVNTENEFEKRLLGEVVPPEEVGVKFDDIGALDSVKETLREVVMLPLQRPELFARGSLTRPIKGVLLFGPPGTGKTMLAKAVTAESGANFIYVSVASLASKWFGEGEKYVKALFSLAHKIAPSVIFIDEIDSLLGKRDRTGEHEAMRKIKNEFMSSWDGLRTRLQDRVLVLGATNRPMDLDDAVIRRMPRRLLVSLPDAANRVRILRVLLRDEALEAGMKLDDVAALTDGYSGSDLRNLCVSAAYRPIREFLAAEKAQKANRSSANEPSSEDSPALGASSLEERETVDNAQEEAKAVGEANAVQQPNHTSATQEAPNAAEQANGIQTDTLEAAGTQGTSGSEPSSSQPVSRTQMPLYAATLGRPRAVEPVTLRALSLADFKAAVKEVGPSVSADAPSMTELAQWNEMYGEGGNRRMNTLSYFL